MDPWNQQQNGAYNGQPPNFHHNNAAPPMTFPQQMAPPLPHMSQLPFNAPSHSHVPIMEPFISVSQHHHQQQNYQQWMLQRQVLPPVAPMKQQAPLIPTPQYTSRSRKVHLESSPVSRAQSQVSKSSRANPMKIQEQALYELGDSFYKHAVSQRINVKTQTHIREYFTLVKLSIASFNKILKMKQKATLRLRIKADLYIAEILHAEADLESLTESPESYLDDAVMLCGDAQEYQEFRFRAEVGIVKSMIVRGSYKHALKQISMSRFGESFMFKYLKFTAQKVLDPLQAHNTIIQIMHSRDFELLEKQTKEFVQLTEITHCLEHGVNAASNLHEIMPDLPNLQLWKLLLGVLREIQFKSLVKSTSSDELTTSLRKINEIVTQRREHPDTPDKLHFLFEGKPMAFEVSIPDISQLYITFYTIFAVSGLNMTFEKRKSQKVLAMASNDLDTLLDSTAASSTIRDVQCRNGNLKKLKNLISFYTFIESSIAEDPDSAQAEGVMKEVYTNCTNPILLNYIMALGYQVRGHLSSATRAYLDLANELEQNEPTMCKYDDMYAIVCLNVSAMVEAQIVHFSQVKNPSKISELMGLRQHVCLKLEMIYTAPNSSYSQKYLFDTTSKFLALLYNTNNIPVFEIHDKIDQILVDQERLKSYPLLLSMLLYVKSTTLNNNSDQKQKSSQSSFNLAKMGYSPLIRYVAGLLNQQNATVARNDQQLEVQKQKLEKIEKSVSQKFGNMFA